MPYVGVVLAFLVAGDVLQIRALSKHWHTECPTASESLWRTLLTLDEQSVDIRGERKEVWNAALLVACQIELALSKAAFGRADILAMLQPVGPTDNVASQSAAEAVDGRVAKHYFLGARPQLFCLVCTKKRGAAALKYSWRHPDAEVQARPVYICISCIIRDQTLLIPIRFGRECFGYDVDPQKFPSPYCKKRYAELGRVMQSSLKRRRRGPDAEKKEETAERET